MSRILITGASGLLGGRLVALASGEHEVTAAYNKHPFSSPDSQLQVVHLDITDEAQVFSLVEKLLPQVIVHAAGWTNADQCETDRKTAYSINVEGTRHVAQAAQAVGAKMVFISSDYVFDGGKGCYREDDPLSPISFYGENKAEGEKIVRELGANHIVARLTVIFGLSPVKRDFVRFVIDSLRNGQRIRVVTDQRGNPSYADASAEVILRLVNGQARGIFHVSGRECIDRYSLGVKVAELFSLDKSLIEPILSRDLSQIAPRPTFGCLDVSKVEAFLGEPMPTLEESLLRYKAQLKS